MYQDLQFVIGFTSIGMEISATLQDDAEPDLCAQFWEMIAPGCRLFCYHPVSTGDYFSACGRPDRHPAPTGTQARPLSRTPVLMSRLMPGEFLYSVGRNISIAYGELITEPMPHRGGIIGVVGPADHNRLWYVGRSLWESQFLRHELFCITLRGGQGGNCG